MFIDAHNHLHQLADPDAAISVMRRAGIIGCVVNGTSEEDWPAVAHLARRHPDFILPSFGLHPWYAHRRHPSWLDSLRRHLDLFPAAVIGECGVDGWVAEPDIETQLAAFLPQIRLARERDLPLTIHALKAWEPLFDALQQEPPPARGFLVHSFGGSAEIAARLLRLGARFSFSGYFLHPKKAPVLAAYSTIPRDRLLLETDAPAMTPPAAFIDFPLPADANHPANLPAIARGFAAALQLDPATLIHDCLTTTRQFFDPGKHHFLS